MGGWAGDGRASSGVEAAPPQAEEVADREKFLVKNALVMDSAANNKDRPGRCDRWRR